LQQFPWFKRLNFASAIGLNENKRIATLFILLLVELFADAASAQPGRKKIRSIALTRLNFSPA
jgi:hypothetical protein